MNTVSAIDMWMPIPPLPEITNYVAENFPKEQFGYLRIFGKRAAAKESIAQFVRSLDRSEQELLALLDQAGIKRALITGFDEKSSSGVTLLPNQLIAPVAARHPNRFIPFAGVDILKGAEAVAELEFWVKERGFRGLSLRPFMIGLPADDRRYYPFYSKCVELGIPLSIHTSANWSTERISDLGHPRHIDVVACDFPELRIIMSHGGYPWVLEAVLLAWKYPHVYLELAAHRPRYLGRSGTGWSPLFRFGPTTVRNKVLFGTGWFLLGRPLAEVVGEFRQLPVEAEVMERWLCRNAEELLGLAGPTSAGTQQK